MLTDKIKIFIVTIIIGIFFYIPNDISHYLPLILSLSLIFFYKFNIQQKLKHIESPFFYLFVLFFYALIIVACQEETDLFFLKTIGKIIILATGIKVIINLFKLSLYQNVLCLFWVLFINVLITLIQYFNILGLSDWAFSLNTTFIKHDIYFRSFRAMGLLSGYDSNGILNALSFHLLILLISHETSKSRRYFFIACSILNLIAVFTSARVGVLALFIGSLLFIFQRKGTWTSRVSPYLKIILPGLLLTLALLSVAPKGTIFDTFNFIFEPFINYSRHHEFRTQSTDALIKEHYKLPKSDSTLFFGNGFDNAHPYYGAHTDVGYIQLIFGLGLTGLFILLAIYLLWIKLIVNALKKSPPGLYRDINFFCLNYILIIFMNSFKGPYLLAYTLIFLFSYSFLLSIEFNPNQIKTINN